MGCSCDKNINCDNGAKCFCGIVLKLKNSSGALVDTLEGTGYDDGSGNVIYQFQSGTVFPTGVLTMTYNSTLERWELRHTDASLYSPDDSILFGTYGTDALCPDTECDLDLTCNTLDFVYAGSSVGDIEWQGDMYNGKKLYRLNTSDYSGPPSWGNVIIYWGNNLNMQESNGITSNRWLWVLLGNYTLETIPFPLEQVISSGSSTQISLLGYLEDGNLGCSDGAFQPPPPAGASPRIETDPSGPQGYTGTIEKVDCGCCDEQVSISIKLSVSVEQDFTAVVTKDIHGNILGHNGIQYYVFNDGSKDLYIYFNGTAWVVGANFSDEDYISTSSGDCPYGFYTKLPYTGVGDPFKIIQIKGVKCFDCCDYYTPRFTNFIRKQRAILVDETSYIRSKEVFGLQCGGDWQDIFRKHLIIDTLSCLPDGVLCEEQEECLIENLYKNCNC
jgi:hypothetical protein